MSDDGIDIDMADIARGRRIVAQAANDLGVAPRKTERPSRESPLVAAMRKLNQAEDEAQPTT